MKCVATNRADDSTARPSRGLDFPFLTYLRLTLKWMERVRVGRQYLRCLPGTWICQFLTLFRFRAYLAAPAEFLDLLVVNAHPRINVLWDRLCHLLSCRS